MLSLAKLFIGMEKLTLEKWYLQELTSIKYKLAVITKPTKW